MDERLSMVENSTDKGMMAMQVAEALNRYDWISNTLAFEVSASVVNLHKSVCVQRSAAIDHR